MIEIKFRKAQIVDLPILYEFEQGIVLAERPFDPTLSDGHINYYDIKAMIENSDTEVVVALDGDTIIASGYVKIKKAKPYQEFDNYAYVGFMYVRPKYRGQGISQKLLEQLKSWAKDKNLTELRLEVYDGNESAVKAYQNFGFTNNLIEMRMKI